jgi:hypothetical protein
VIERFTELREDWGSTDRGGAESGRPHPSEPETRSLQTLARDVVPALR